VCVTETLWCIFMLYCRLGVCLTLHHHLSFTTITGTISTTTATATSTAAAAVDAITTVTTTTAIANNSNKKFNLCGQTRAMPSLCQSVVTLVCVCVLTDWLY